MPKASHLQENQIENFSVGKLGSGKCGVSETEYTRKCQIMGMNGKRQEILMTAVLVYENKNVWQKVGNISFHRYSSHQESSSV